MSGFLDEYPLDFSKREVTNLRDAITQTFYRAAEIEDVVLRAGLSPGEIVWGGPPVLQWQSILIEASRKQRIPALLDAACAGKPALAKRVDEILADAPVLEPDARIPDELATPKASGWKNFGGERIIVEGSETLLHVAFLSVGVERSRSICRITSTFAGGKRRKSFATHGTASRIGTDLILTNHHVLHDEENGGAPATHVQTWFDYELDPFGGSCTPTVVRADPTSIVGDPDLDWAVVRAAEPIPPRYPILKLTGAGVPEEDDYVFIIQHPDGLEKKVGLSHNLVRHVDDRVLQYWTDTKKGSSGAPVFNDRWQVVGLHHLWLEAPEGDSVAYRNQGIRIERVLEGLAENGIEVGTGR